MYGIDRKTVWYAYDLTCAYTTVITMVGPPDYSMCRRISTVELDKLSNEDKLYSYIIINTEFEFPEGIKYPPSLVS
jgi:hypothetical protein